VGARGFIFDGEFLGADFTRTDFSDCGWETIFARNGCGGATIWALLVNWSALSLTNSAVF
jgi:hypothetical protein